MDVLSHILGIPKIGGGGGVVPPAAPTGLTATVFSTSRIDLAWTDNATNEDGYKIYRSTNGVDYAEIDDIAADSESYSDTTITAGTTYYYKVAAYNAGGEAESNVDAANTLTLGLLSVYEFENAAALGEDAHSTNVLTNINGVSQAAGAVGGAAIFVAASSQALIRSDSGASDPFRLAGVSWAMATLVKPSTINTGGALRYLINKWTGGVINGVGYWLAQINATVQIAIQNAAEGLPDTVTTGNILSTSSYALVIAWLDEDADTLNIQVNNGTPVSAALNRTRADSINPFVIGRRSDQLLNFYDGELDQVFIWKGRILTAAERTSLYNSGNFRSYAYINPT